MKDSGFITFFAPTYRENKKLPNNVFVRSCVMHRVKLQRFKVLYNKIERILVEEIENSNKVNL